MEDKYQRNSTTLVRDIFPASDIKDLIEIFMDSAAVDMGNEYDKSILERLVYIIKSEFGYLPVCYIASGFAQGAMGKYGAGRLVPRTIHGWLNEVSQEYNRKTEKDRQTELASEIITTYDLRRYPIGKAIIQKIKWYEAGKLYGDEWDRIDLKQLATAIGEGKEIEFDNFYR
jgi:hypothetical protein